MLDIQIKKMEALQDFAMQMERFLLERKISSEQIFDCRLVANELIGNVFRHSKGVARLCMAVKNGFVEICVYSTEEGYTPPKTSSCSDVYAENGRGLYLIDSICYERVCTQDGGIMVKIKTV